MCDIMCKTGEKRWQEGGYSLYSHDGCPPLLDWKESTLDEILSYRALISPDEKQFMILGDGENITDEMTWGQAHDRAMHVAGLLARFVPERSHILLCFENSLEAVAGYFGCTYANMIPVSGVYPGAAGSGDRLFDILEDSGAVAVLGLRQTLVDFRRVACGRAKSVKWIPIEGAEKAEPLYRRHAARQEDIALVQYTSGSVGRPRGVQISHANLGANLMLLLDRTGFRPGVRGISWLPLSHDMGLMTGLFVGVVAGGPCLLMTPRHFIEKPERWFRAISRYRLGFSAGPNFAYDLCTRLIPDEALEDIDLSSWQRSVIGAEMIERSTIERFLARFGRLGVKETVFRPGYGLAETTLLIASGRKMQEEVVFFGQYSRKALAEGRAVPTDDVDDMRVLASSGQVVEDHVIAVVDPETGMPLAERQVGELWLSGPSVAPGYLNRPEENRARFGLVLEGFKTSENIPRQFFRSRDMGFFDKDALYITGRMDYRLTIEGRSFDPDDLASVIREKTSVFEGRGLAVFCHEHKLHILGEVAPALPEGRYEPLMEQVARIIGQICPARYVRVMLLRAGGILRTPSGKMRLLAMREALVAGHVPFLAERLFGEETLGLVQILGQSEKRF